MRKRKPSCLDVQQWSEVTLPEVFVSGNLHHAHFVAVAGINFVCHIQHTAVRISIALQIDTRIEVAA